MPLTDLNVGLIAQLAGIVGCGKHDADTIEMSVAEEGVVHVREEGHGGEQGPVVARPVGHRGHEPKNLVLGHPLDGFAETRFSAGTG